MVTPRIATKGADLALRIILAVMVFVVGGMLACPGVLWDARDIPPRVQKAPEVEKLGGHAVIRNEDRAFYWFYKSYARTKV